MIHINRDVLLEAINLVSKIVVKQSTLPILDNLLVNAHADGRVELAGSDLSIYVSTTCEAEHVDATASFTLPAHKLVSICKATPADAEIKIAAITGDVATIQSGRSKFRIATLPAADFPDYPQDTEDASFLIPASQFKFMLETCCKSMGKDDVRAFLNGVYIHTQHQEELLHIAGTDGHRLSCSQFPVIGIPPIASIVPRKAILLLLKNIPNNDNPIRLNFGAHSFSVTWGKTTVKGKVLGGKFPDYQRIIPQHTQSSLVNREEILALLERAMILKVEKYHAVKLTWVNNKLSIESASKDDSFEDAMTIECATTETVAMGFNVNYLHDAITSITSENVVIDFSDTLTAITLHDPDDAGSMHVVMPMRL